MIISILGKQSLNKLIDYINTPTNSGETPLSIAVKAGLLDIAKLLVKNGAEVNQANNDNETLLHWAAIRGHSKVVELLLQQEDIKVNATDKTTGSTPLHIAAGNSHLNIVELLVKHKQIHLNATDKYGRTPLHIAAQNGHLEVAELLLKNGANINQSIITSIISQGGVCGNEKKALQIFSIVIDNIKNSAATNIDLDKMLNIVVKSLAGKMRITGERNKKMTSTFIDKLKEHDVNLDIAFLKAVKNRESKEAKILLDNGANPFCIDQDGNNALMIASTYVKSRVTDAKFILDSVKNNLEKEQLEKLVNAQNNRGETAIMMAVKSDKINSNIFDTLLSMGADLTIADKYGKTASDYAKEEKSNTTYIKTICERAILQSDSLKREYDQDSTSSDSRDGNGRGSKKLKTLPTPKRTADEPECETPPEKKQKIITHNNSTPTPTPTPDTRSAALGGSAEKRI